MANSAHIKQKYSRVINGRRHVWDVEKLWALSNGKPVQKISIENITEFEQDCWFTGRGSTPHPTIRNVAMHCKRIINADLGYPIIMSSDGQLVDGGHRVARAFIDGLKEIEAVYIKLPQADVVE